MSEHVVLDLKKLILICERCQKTTKKKIESLDSYPSEGFIEFRKKHKDCFDIVKIIHQATPRCFT